MQQGALEKKRCVPLAAGPAPSTVGSVTPARLRCSIGISTLSDTVQSIVVEGSATQRYAIIARRQRIQVGAEHIRGIATPGRAVGAGPPPMSCLVAARRAASRTHHTGARPVFHLRRQDGRDNERYAADLTSIFFFCSTALAVFGIVTVRTPLEKSAAILPRSTPSGT